MSCGTRKGQYPKEEKASLQPERGRNRESHTTEGRPHEQFHAHNPPSFGFYKVNERAPQWFDDPWQIEPTGIEGNFSIAQSQLLVEDDRDGHDRHVWQSFREI